MELIFDEIEEAVPDTEGDITEDIELRDALDAFLSSLPTTRRQIFVKRYFYMKSLKDIAREMSISKASVKVVLWRTRKELRDYLESRGIVI